MVYSKCELMSWLMTIGRNANSAEKYEMGSWIELTKVKRNAIYIENRGFVWLIQYSKRHAFRMASGLRVFNVHVYVSRP